MGSVCKDEVMVEKVEDIKFERLTDSKLVLLKCSSNLTNTNEIDKKYNSKTKVYCSESCQFKEKYPFYGNDEYSGDSSICRAAFYQDIISDNGGEFEIEVLPGKQRYKAGPAKKTSCDPQEKSIAFETSFKLIELISPELQAQLDYKEGEVIDIKHPDKCWISGKVSSIEKLGNKSVLTINADNKDFKFNFPSKEIVDNLSKCGTKYIKNKCDKENILKLDPAANMKKIKLECNSFRNGDCMSNPLDCVFEEYELNDKNKIECNNDMEFIKVDNTSRCKSLNCMTKCIRNSFENQNDCENTCPYKCKRDNKLFKCSK